MARHRAVSDERWTAPVVVHPAYVPRPLDAAWRRRYRRTGRRLLISLSMYAALAAAGTACTWQHLAAWW